MYSTNELIKLSISKQILNELFSETLSDLEQDYIYIDNPDKIDIEKCLSQLGDNDILITNDSYKVQKTDFMIMDASGDIILSVSPDGLRINDVDIEYYLEESALDKLSKIYDRLRRCGKVYTLKLKD